MPSTNFPGGVTSYGIPVFGSGSVYDVPPTNVWFVCNRSGVINGDGTSRDRPMLSIADALARSAIHDWIYVLAEHAESVTASNVFSGTASSGPNTGAQTILKGVRIIGEGRGACRPALTFTAAASTIAMAASCASLENFQLLCPQTGTTTVAAMVTITAANCSVVKCNMQLSSSATALCTTGISTSSAATEADLSYNVAWGLTGTPTSWFAPTGTVGANRITVTFNNIQLPLSATTGGCVDLSANSGTAPTDWYMYRNVFVNKTTNSTVALKGVAGCGGEVVEQFCGIANATGGATAINTPGSWNMSGCTGGVIGKNAIAITPASG